MGTVKTKYWAHYSKTLILAASLATFSAFTTQAEPVHAISMHGKPALNADFTHFPYANPDAPKGGKITYCVVGTFDNLNPFILNSLRTTARGMVDQAFGNLIFQPLMQRSYDEAFTMYGLIAEKVEWDEERTFLEFHINPKATWSDGVKITPEDVIFTYETFTEKGRPPYNGRMKRIASIEKTGDNKVRFTFNETSNREYPLIIALTPIIPKHATDAENFESTTLQPMVGSGPYVVSKVDAGQRITFTRNSNYWGQDIPSQKGFNNYDEITIEYFRSSEAMFEAFKKGLCAVYEETNPVKWDSQYDFPAIKDGKISQAEFTTQLPTPMVGFAFNTRKPVFANLNVRKALAMLYDFEWVNQNIFLNRFKRIQGYWTNSELSSIGRPADEAEKALLAPFMDEIDPTVMDGTFRQQTSDGTGRDRTVLRAALNLLQAEGYKLEGGTLSKDGVPLTFEILTSGTEQEKMALAYQRNLAKIGVQMTVRALDDAQIQQRKKAYEYDMMIVSIGFSGSLSPGAEQTWRWGSISRDQEGTFNYSGVASKGVDAMIDTMVNAREKEAFIASIRAMDRLLLSGFYMVPTQFKDGEWIAHSTDYAYPEYTSVYGSQFSTWWYQGQ